jgi:hypothetical protein
MNIKLVAPKPSTRRWPLVAVLAAGVLLAADLLRRNPADLTDFSRGLGIAVLAVTIGWVAMVLRDIDGGHGTPHPGPTHARRPFARWRGGQPRAMEK